MAANNLKDNRYLWGEFETKFTPLISFHAIIDMDMGLIKNILINYRNENVFDLKKDKKYFEILGEIYRRKETNPLYYLLKVDNQAARTFVDECYQEFLAEKEEEILSYSVSTDMYNLMRDFYNNSEIIPTILYYSQYQKNVLDNDPFLCKIKSVYIEDLKTDQEKRNIYDQFYFKTIDEAELFLPLSNKTFYFSTTGRNLNETNDDILFSNEDVYEIYKRGNKINLFDIYRMDIIGGYSNNGNSE